MAKHMYTQFEHDACGIGTIVNIDGRQDHRVVDDALHIVEKLEHRAGKDATGEVGDGVGGRRGGRHYPHSFRGSCLRVGHDRQ